MNAPIMTDMNANLGFGTIILLLSFLLLSQRRMSGLLMTYAMQAFVLAAAAAWQAVEQNAPHLFITAAVAFGFKGLVIPLGIRRMVNRFKIRQQIDPVYKAGLILLVSIGLVALSILLVFPVTADAGALTRESLAVALSIVLIGFLMMVTSYHVIGMVVGFMSIENGLVLAAVGVRGMPLVVELSVAFSVLVAFIIFFVFFTYIREHSANLDVRQLEKFRGERHE